MQNIAREVRLLAAHDIDTTEQLAAHKEGVTGRIAELSDTRKHLRCRARSIPDEEEQAAVAEISELSEKLAELRREARLCEDIETRSAAMRDKIRRAAEAEKEEKSRNGKDVRKNEPFRGRR
jgi:hypothetical protein